MALAEKAKLVAELSLQDKLSAGLGQASKNLGKFESGLGRAGKGVAQVGKGALKAGAIVAGVAATGFALATKTAIDFDDAFASVRKTVAGSPEELQALNDQLHALATRIPVSYTDLADIAAEAGALGVPTKSVAKFTETVARLSASTQGFTVEAAAEAFGKFRNTLKLTDDEMTNAASSLIALGNAGASSESDIIETGKRFAAAGHAAGLSAAEVLGFASAITSLGVEPEAAGGALSRTFNKITREAAFSSGKFKVFAKTAGVSAKDFKKQWGKDATGAFSSFLKGLSKLNKFQAARVLNDAGINNTRDINAIQLLAQNYGELGRQVDLSTDAFDKNTELSDVSNARFDTLKNKLAIVKQGFYEAGYNIAEGFLPALGRAASKLTTFLQDPENKKSLRDIGTRLGEALDKVDFDKLLTAAKSAVAVLQPLVDILLTVAGALNALPAEVKGAGAALLIGNKLSGGALAAGAGNIVGGLAETLTKSLAANIPVFGKAFVQPVFVTNIGAGGLGGGGGLGSGGGTVAGGGASLLTKGLAAASAFISIAAVEAVREEVSAQSTAQGAALQTQLASGINVQTSAELHTSLNAVNQGIKSITDNPLLVYVRGDALASLQSMQADLQKQISITSGGKEIPLPGGKTALQDVFKPGVDATNKNKDATVKSLSDLGGIERTGNSSLFGAIGNSASRIASAVANARVVPNVTTTVTVNVTPAGVQKATNTQVHYGKPNGSAGGGNSHATGSTFGID